VNHRSAQRHLAGYLDGALPPNRRRRLEEHLESCTDCSTEVLELRETVALLRGLPEPDAPADLAEAVLRRIAAGEAEPTWSPLPHRWLGNVSEALSSPRLAIPLAAVVAAVALVGIAPNLQFFSVLPDTAEQAQSASAVGTASKAPLIPESKTISNASVRRSSPEMPVPLQLAAGPRGRLVQVTAESRSQRPLFSAGHGMPIRGDGVLLSADEWIEVLIARPSNFAHEHGRLSEIERELWVTYLARRALETQRFDSLVQALRRSSEPATAALAEDFALLGGLR